jgi:hypothetical protein
MDPAALLAIPFFVAAAAHDAAMRQHYAHSAAQYGQPYAYYAVPPGSGWVPGAALGAGIGALSGHGGPLVAGALIGGAIGHAATTPPAAWVSAAPYPEPVAPPARSSASTQAFVEHWQRFMEPAGRR